MTNWAASTNYGLDYVRFQNPCPTCRVSVPWIAHRSQRDGTDYEIDCPVCPTPNPQPAIEGAS